VDEMHHPEKYAVAKEQRQEIFPLAAAKSSQNLEMKIWVVMNYKKHEIPEEEYLEGYNSWNLD
jgi:hypothetical protein